MPITGGKKEKAFPPGAREKAAPMEPMKGPKYASIREAKGGYVVTCGGDDHVCKTLAAAIKAIKSEFGGSAEGDED